MKKLIFKLLCPSAKSLSEYSATLIQKAVNDTKLSEYADKYGKIATNATEIQQWIVKMLEDGKVDELEKKDIQDRLLPLFEKLKEII